MALKCDNCGAPMSLVAGQDYFFCEYCYSFHFQGESNADGVVLIDEEGKLPCPVCESTLLPASLELERVLFCKKCKGMLLKRRSFVKVVEQRRAGYTGRKLRTKKRLREEELTRKTACPLCGKAMLTHPYYGPGDVIIDNCIDCNMIWLDDGELTIIERSQD
ncbi:zf-TFIIB domain-containing protein [Myxococcota bacterium]|nr:zf-TFIIB domain-containing protein [Myxococcota bacterium]MBU1534599.1 zf-TFIIB domain-containing protein [Myxococcota bacterium]